MPLLSEYLNLSLVNPFFSRKSKYLTMSCLDVIGTETVELSFAILEVILVTYKNTFFQRKSKILLLKFFFKTKPLIVGIIYGHPNQSDFLESINAIFDKLDTDIKELYILGYSNLNMYQKNKYIIRGDSTISSKFLSSDIKKYHQFCTMHGLRQLIKSPTRVTCSTSTLIHHILASFPSRVSQKAVIDVGISDHQLIFCTRKILRLKTSVIYKYLNFRSFKNSTVGSDKEALKQLDFLNYKTFDDINGVYCNFFQKIMTIIDKITPYRHKQIQGNILKNGLIARF